MNRRSKINHEIDRIRVWSPGFSWSALLLLLCLGCRTVSEPPLSRFEFSKPQMGAPFRIVLYAPDAAQAETPAQAAFRRVEQLNSILSDYDTDSELNQLSHSAGSGKAVPLSPDLWIVLAQAQRYAALSEGVFDVTIGPCVNLWRKARREQKVPDRARLEEARARVGYKKLRLDPARRSATMLAPDMRLDLGGIAKGYAVDEAMKVLRKHGIKRALVAAAGDIAVSDPPPGQGGWKIEIGSLEVSNAPPSQSILLANAAVSTSGDVFQYVEFNGIRYSHIVDPRTCLGLTDHSLVSVIAPDCTTSDALATAISVLGPRKGIQLADKTKGASARILRQPDRQVEVYTSGRWRR